MLEFVDYLNSYEHKKLLSFLENKDTRNIEEVLVKKDNLDINDFALLLSDSGEKYLELMAQKAQLKTRQRFGNVIQMYAPLYISNECTNTCTYCSFTMENKIPRKTLSVIELQKELSYLKSRGFCHILLVSGEHQKVVNADYIVECLNECKDFSSVSIEFAPFSEKDYRRFIQAGASGLTVYQETYNREDYNKVHIRGQKKNFDWRLASAERGARAGMRKINLGILLGLSVDWQRDCVLLAQHLFFMYKYYWRVKYMVSLPRLCKSETDFCSLVDINNKKFVQILLAYRLVFPDVGINLSTREPAYLRDGLIGLGITDMSAESATDPGGYTLKDKNLKQFEISDERNLDEVIAVIEEKDYEVVWKDWDKNMIG